MTKMKHVFSAIAAFAVAAFVMVLTPSVDVQAAQATTVTVGDWEFSQSSGTVYASKYVGTAKEVTVPTSVTINGSTYVIRVLGDKAFDSNTTVEKVTVPAKITQIGDYSFRNCTNLKYVRFEGDLANLSSSSISSNIYGNSAFFNAGANSDELVIEFAPGVTKIPQYLCATTADYNEDHPCHVTKIILADSVKEIGEGAFYHCTDLVSIEGGNGLELIGKKAFYYDSSLTSVTFPEGLREIKEYAFEDTALKTVELPSTVTAVGKAAFYDCTRLERAILHSPEMTLGDNAFKYCSSLNYVRIEGDLTDLSSSSTTNYIRDQSSVFYSAGANTNEFTIEFANGVTKIPAYLCATYDGGDNLSQCHVTKVIIPDSVTEIRDGAFYNCKNLVDITISNNIKTIGKKAFYNAKFTEVTIGSRIESIGDNAFDSVDNLTIKGYTGSAAQTYAEKNNIPFVSLGFVAQKFAEYQGYTFYKTKDDVICYDSNDNLVINDFKCDGTYTYYFQADGTCMKDRLTYHPDGVHVIYFDENGHEVFSDFAHVSKSIAGTDVDDNCFFDVFGYMYVDVLTWDKAGTKLLYANPYGRLECAGWFQFSETVKWADGSVCEGIASEPNTPRYGYGQQDCTLLRDTQTYDWRGIPCYLQGNGVALY